MKVLEATIVEIIVFLLVRLFYFAAAFIGLGFGAAFFLGTFSRRSPSSYDPDDPLPAMLLFEAEFWVVIAGLSVMIALVGPHLYHRRTMRGRGTLLDIKEADWEDVN